jgi:hypothetical protein
MDATLEPEAQRLTLAAALMGLARRRCGRRIASASNAADLLALAHDLQQDIAAMEQAHGYRFEPAYPGATAGPEAAMGGWRLVLACTGYKDGVTLGVVFTTLIPGRPPQVSIAPVGTPIPDGWQPLADPV